MKSELRQHMIDGNMVVALNALMDFAEWSQLTYHLVFPRDDSDWWNRHTPYDAQITVQIDTPESDPWFDREKLRQEGRRVEFHVELPDQLDSRENRETILLGAKQFLRWKTRLQIVTFGDSFRGSEHREGWDAERPKSENIDLYLPDREVRASAAVIFNPEFPLEIRGIRGNTQRTFYQQ